VPRKVARRDGASPIVVQNVTISSPPHEVHTAAAASSSSRGEVGRRLLAVRALALGALVVLLASGCGGSKSHTVHGCGELDGSVRGRGDECRLPHGYIRGGRLDERKYISDRQHLPPGDGH
jgi:hypothetical protein